MSLLFPQWLTVARLPWRLTALQAAHDSSPLAFVVLTVAVEVMPVGISAASVRRDSPGRTAMRVSAMFSGVCVLSIFQSFNIFSLTLYFQTSMTVKVVLAAMAALALIKSTLTSVSVLMDGRDPTVRPVSSSLPWMSLEMELSYLEIVMQSKNVSNFSNYI